MNKIDISIENSKLIRNDPKQVIDTQDEYIKQATADNTRRAYKSAIKQFEANGGLLPANEHAIAQYITNKAPQLNPRTLSLHLTALSHWHRYQQLLDPTQTPYIRKLLKGIKRMHGIPKRKAQALYPEHIDAMVTLLQAKQNLKSIRDNALIQIAYFGAFRRSELIAMRVEDIKFESRGLLILIPRSKTDQTGTGKIKSLPYGKKNLCPIAALKHWLNSAEITEGYVFRAVSRWGKLQAKPLHADSINVIVKSLAKECNFDFVPELSSHSLRRGFATSAANAGANFDSIKRQGGWENDNTVREYIEAGQIFDQNAADSLINAYFSK